MKFEIQENFRVKFQVRFDWFAVRLIQPLVCREFWGEISCSCFRQLIKTMYGEIYVTRVPHGSNSSIFSNKHINAQVGLVIFNFLFIGEITNQKVHWNTLLPITVERLSLLPGYWSESSFVFFFLFLKFSLEICIHVCLYLCASIAFKCQVVQHLQNSSFRWCSWRQESFASAVVKTVDGSGWSDSRGNRASRRQALLAKGLLQCHAPNNIRL